MLNYFSFAVSATVLGPLLCGRQDVMYVWHLPTTVGMVAWVIHLLRRVPFLYGVHDLWPESVVAAGMMRGGPLVKILNGLQRFVYSRAHLIGVGSPGFIPHLESKRVPRSKVHHLPDWADEEVFHPVARDEELAKTLGMTERFNVVFGGQLGIAQGLDTIVEAAELLREQTDIQFVLAGEGVERSRLEARVQRAGLENVRFLGQVPPEQMNRIYGLSDVLLVHLKAGFFSSLSIPGKTYAYLASGKPMLAALDGSAARMIEEIGAALVCSPEDPRRMAQAVLDFRAMTPADRERMGALGLERFRSHYSRRAGVALHEKMLSSLVWHD